MNARAFFEKVALMREYQKDYLKTRSNWSLSLSRKTEREIDDEIRRVRKLLEQGFKEESVRGGVMDYKQ